MTGQALERHQGAGVALLPNDSEMRGIEFNARAIVALDSRLKGRPDAKELGFGLAVTLWNYGVPGTVINAKKLHLIPAGKDKVDVFESAQLLLGLLTMHGHDVWFVEETEDRVVLQGRRFGEGRTHEVVYDAERARKSGALDEWVQRKVKLPGDQWETTEKFTVAVDGVAVPGPYPEWVQKMVEARRVKRNDYWFAYRVDAMGNRAIRRMAKRLGADALLGISAPEPGERIERRPDDIVLDDEFGEPLDDPAEDGAGAGPPVDSEPKIRESSPPAPVVADEADPEAAHRNECSRIHAASDRIPNGTWRQLWAKAWREAGLPWREAGLPRALDLTPEQLEPARALTRQYLALAALDSIGLSSKDERHDFVSAASAGETESTKALTAEQLQAVLRAVDEVAARRAAAAAATPPHDEEPECAEDDPERPF